MADDFQDSGDSGGVLRLSESQDWCVLDEVDVTEIEHRAISRLYGTGEIVFHEGDRPSGVYYVRSGLIGVRKADHEGNSTLLKIAWPGDTLGYRPLVANERHRASADALRQSAVDFVDAASVERLIETTPALGLNFLKRAAKELGDAEQRFHDSVTLDIRTRFAHLLLVLQERYGQPVEDGSIKLMLPISRSDIAAMLGVRRESVSRAIRELEDSGVASFKKRHVLVPDPDTLISMLAKT